MTDRAQHRHDSPSCTGVLLNNLGTPDEPTAAAVRRYLAEFLSDPRVVELPRVLWWPVLHGFILRTRPRRSAEAYRRIWTAEGSPLYVISRKLAVAVEAALGSTDPEAYRVELAMRYGRPSITNALERMRQVNVRRLLVLPLYPQYSAATTGSVFDRVTACLHRWRWVPELRFINHYHDDEHYINALVESIRVHQAEHGKPERLLFSFHGIPRSHFLAGDPYFCQCHKTARLVVRELDLPEERWAVSFQSRFGPREWLKPYTDRLLVEWAGSGVTKVQVICPGFSADCLETLGEIQILNRRIFLEAGGKEFTYIAALNDQPAHVDALLQIIQRHCRAWDDTVSDRTQQDRRRELEETRQRALRMGAKE